MILSWLLLVALVIGGVWLLARAVSGRPWSSGSGSRSSARTILEERLARGEIDRDEFQERRRALEG